MDRFTLGCTWSNWSNWIFGFLIINSDVHAEQAKQTTQHRMKTLNNDDRAIALRSDQKICRIAESSTIWTRMVDGCLSRSSPIFRTKDRHPLTCLRQGTSLSFASGPPSWPWKFLVLQKSTIGPSWEWENTLNWGNCSDVNGKKEYNLNEFFETAWF